MRCRSSSGRANCFKAPIPFQLPGPITTLRVGFVLRIIARACAAHSFHNAGVTCPFGSFRISNTTLAGASLKCSETCSQNAISFNLQPVASLAHSLKLCSSRITVRSFATAALTAQSNVLNQAALSWLAPFICEKACKLIRTVWKPPSRMRRKWRSWKRALEGSFHNGSYPMMLRPRVILLTWSTAPTYGNAEAVGGLPTGSNSR